MTESLGFPGGVEAKLPEQGAAVVNAVPANLLAIPISGESGLLGRMFDSHEMDALLEKAVSVFVRDAPTLDELARLGPVDPTRSSTQNERVYHDDRGTLYGSRGSGYGYGGGWGATGAGSGGSGDAHDTGYVPSHEVEPPKDCEYRVWDRTDVRDESQAQFDAYLKAAQAVEMIIEKLGDTVANRTISLSTNYGQIVFDVREAYQLLSLTDFKINREGTSYGNDPSPDVRGVGSADRNSGNPIEQLNYDVIVNRFSQSPEAAQFLIVHELVHTTLGLWNARPSASASSNDKVYYERVTNSAAKALMDAIGLPTYNYSPPLGYDPSVTTITAQGDGDKAGSTPVCG